MVPALGAGRAVPRGPCPSACPVPVPCSVWHAWGGAVRSRFPPTWLGVLGVAAGRPRGGAFYRCDGRLGSCAPPPLTARPLGGLPGPAIHVLWARACGFGGPALSPRPARPVGAARRGAGPWRSCAGGRAGWGPVGRGVALPHSVPLPSLGRQQSGCHSVRSETNLPVSVCALQTHAYGFQREPGGSYPASVCLVDHVLHGYCPNVMTLVSQRRAVAYYTRGE